MRSLVIAQAVLLLLCHTSIAEEPLHLVISEVGNRAKTYDEKVTLMAEIQGKLNFSLRGDFSKAHIVSASVIAPDGKGYDLKPIGKQPPAATGMFVRFLSISNGNGFGDFSIGSWMVNIKFDVDGKRYQHSGKYLVTWRKPEEGIWGMQHWANQTKKPNQKKDASQAN